MSRALGLALAVPALAGCALLPWSSEPAWRLLPPSSFGRTLVAEQRLAITVGQEARGGLTLTTVVSIKRERMTIVGLDPIGRRALTIDYDGSSIDVQPPEGLPEGLDAHTMLADLQQAFWPLDVLQAGVPTGWRIIEPTPNHRQVRYRGEQRASIHYDGKPWNGRVTLRNERAGYTIEIVSREMR